jgi:uncharacterized protein YqeY
MLRDKLNTALKDAMRAKETATLSTVRMILAAIKDRDIAARPKGITTGVSDDEILSLFGTMIKQRREAIALYEQGGRQELADKEKGEIAVIERFMPQQLDQSGLEAAIAKGIAETGAKSVKDLGGLMAWLKANYAGQMDFGKAAGQAKKQLGG